MGCNRLSCFMSLSHAFTPESLAPGLCHDCAMCPKVCITVFIDSLGGSISAPVMPFYAQEFHASSSEIGYGTWPWPHGLRSFESDPCKACCSARTLWRKSSHCQCSDVWQTISDVGQCSFAAPTRQGKVTGPNDFTVSIR